LPHGVVVASESGPTVVAGDHLARLDQNDNIYRDKLPRRIAGIAAGGYAAAQPGDCARRYPVQIDDSGGRSPF
jgi:hypothetical protein